MDDCTTPLKRCTKCGEEKPATSEHFRLKTKNSVQCRSICRACERESFRAYREANKEKRYAQRRAYYQANKEQQKAYQREYYYSHIDEVREYYRQNRERIAERRSERRFEEREYYRVYRVENAERFTLYRRRRRHAKRSSNGQHSIQDIKLQGDTQNWRCWWCSCDCKHDYHVDHRVALSRGGSNDAGNIVISCPSCNRHKSDKLPHEWSDRLL